MALTLRMAADATTFGAVGEVIGYEYQLANTGGVALDVVSVTDTVLADVPCPSGPLEPNGSVTCSGSYRITQADRDAGLVTNIAHGFGLYGEGGEVASDEAGLTIPATKPAALTLELEADRETFSAVDEVIAYEYLLTNTGGVALDVVYVIDTKLGKVACPSGPLELGGSVKCSVSYRIAQADFDAGYVEGVAGGRGVLSESEEVVSNEARLTITLLAPKPPALTLELEADRQTFSAVGEVIAYEYWLTNTGGVALDDLSVYDAVVGDVYCPSGPLEPGGSVLCEGDYSITEADLYTGSVTTFPQGFGTYGESGAEVESSKASMTITAPT